MQGKQVSEGVFSECGVIRMRILDIIFAYYFFIFVIVGLLGSLFISMEGNVYDDNRILSDLSEFIKCVFMYQVDAYKELNKEINIIGIVILEILITISVWFLNVMIFLCLIIVLILKMICNLFLTVFKIKKHK